MTENRLDQLTSVAISLRVERKPSFMLLLTREGTVKRMGYSAIDNYEQTVADTEDPSIFERFLAGLPTDVLEHAGSHEAEGNEGALVICRIEFAGTPEPVTYEMTYSSESARLSRYMQLMVDLGEELTDEWYGSNVTLTPILDLPPVQKRPPSAPAPLVTQPAHEPPPPPAYEPPAHAYDPSPAPADDLPADPEPEHEEPVDEEGEAEEAGSATAARPGSRARPRGRPKASHQRFGMAVVLDLFVITGVYGILSLMTGAALPLGAALFFLVLAEVGLLQFLRMSPGYWLLGMRAAPGAFPTVDPDQLAGESIVTHAVASVLLVLGLTALVAWTQYQDPIPFFGFERAGWFTAIVSVLFGAAFLASGVFIFRNDVRGVWIGGGATAFTFLSIWFARGSTLNGWLRLELMRKREAQGRPVFNPLDLDPVLGRVLPVTFLIALGCGVGLYFVWKRFTGPEGARPGPDS